MKKLLSILLCCVLVSMFAFGTLVVSADEELSNVDTSVETENSSTEVSDASDESSEVSTETSDDSADMSDGVSNEVSEDSSVEVSGETSGDESSTPQTGDATNMIVFGLIALASVGGMALLIGRKNVRC